MQDNKQASAKIQLIFSTLLFAVAFIAEVYTMFNYPKQYFVIAIFAIIMLVFLYMIVNSVFKLRNIREKRREEQYESIFKSEKASYMMLKKYFEEIDDKIDILQASSKIPTEEIVNAQKGVAKAVISRSRENAEAIIASNDQVMDRISEFEEKLSNNNAEIISEQKDISSDVINQLVMKQQELAKDLKDMEIRLNQAIMQTQQIISTQPVQLTADVNVPTQPVTVQMTGFTVPVATTSGAVVNSAPVEVPREIQEDDPVVDSFVEEEIQEIETEEEVSVDDITVDDVALDEIAAGDDITSDDAALDDITVDDIIADDITSEDIALDDITADDITSEDIALDDITADDITSEDIALDDITVDDITSDHITLEDVALDDIALDENIAEEPIVEEEAPPMPDLSDPNKKLSPEEIAAMFANAGSVTEEAAEEKKAEENVTEAMEVEEPAVEEKEVPPMPDLSDPNKKLSPEEIAAMFANAGSVTEEAAEEKIAEENVTEAVEVEEPVVEKETPPMPDLSDPNKKLSPEEIEALIASL